MPIPARAATSSTVRSVASSRCWAWRTRCWATQAPGDWPVSSRKRRVKVRTLIEARRARVATSSGRCEVGLAPRRVRRRSSRRCAAARCCSMNWACPPSRQGGTTMCRATALATAVPWSRADEVQAQVDAGAEPGRREHPAVVGEEDVLVERGLGVEPAEVVGVLPVGRRAVPVEDARPRRGRRHPCRSTPTGRRRARSTGRRAGRRAGCRRGAVRRSGCPGRSRSGPWPAPRRPPRGRGCSPGSRSPARRRRSRPRRRRAVRRRRRVPRRAPAAGW